MSSPVSRLSSLLLLSFGAALASSPAVHAQAGAQAPAQPAAQAAPTAPATPTQPATGATRREPARFKVPMDPARARELYVSTDPKDHSPGRDFARDVRQKADEDARYAALCAGTLECQKVKYRSSVGDLDVPAHLFQPLASRGPRAHAAMVWVHGGVHGNWGLTMFPFVKEAVARGYVIVAPEYRGSTGYGEAYHRAIDYGGYEVDDVMSAVDYLKTLPHVDPARIGIMGWSHGGYIALLSVFRDVTPFKAAAAIVPVTNLVFRLSYKGPEYQWEFATQERLRGLPFERREEYIRRSPLYQVDKLRIPLLVHVATNDTDVDFVEDQQIVDALRSRKADLAETKIYVDPPPWGPGAGHGFSRRVDPKTLQRVDTAEQVDSWNRVWAFFEWQLRPSDDPSKAEPVSR